MGGQTEMQTDKRVGIQKDGRTDRHSTCGQTDGRSERLTYGRTIDFYAFDVVFGSQKGQF